MKPLKTVALLVVILLGVGAVTPSVAHGPRVRFGVSIGAPLYWPGYGYYGYGPNYYYPPSYYASPYYYPPAVAPAQPAYVEQSNPQAAPSAESNSWYYCAESKAYYPYVKQCPSEWQRVPAQPPA